MYFTFTTLHCYLWFILGDDISTYGSFYDMILLRVVHFTTLHCYFFSFYDPLSISDCNVDCRMTITC